MSQTPDTSPELRIRCDQVPALLGVDPRISKWTLWQAFARNHGVLMEARSERLSEAVHDVAVKWALPGGTIGAKARLPRDDGEILHETLPLSAHPDFVIPDSPAHGAGPGIGILEIVERGQWRQSWLGRGPDPVPPPWIQARLQAAMLCAGVSWSLAIPQIGWANSHPTILVQADTDMQANIGTEIHAFMRTVAENQPPDPDGRADGGTLARLAELCPPRTSNEPETLEGPEGEWLADALQRLAAHQSEIQALDAQRKEIQNPMKDLEAQIVQRVGAGRQIQAAGHVVSVKIESPTIPDLAKRTPRLVMQPADEKRT